MPWIGAGFVVFSPCVGGSGACSHPLSGVLVGVPACRLCLSVFVSLAPSLAAPDSVSVRRAPSGLPNDVTALQT